jgi:hypothetical protein
MYRIQRFGVVKTATMVAVMYMLVTAIVFVPVAILVAIAGRGSAVDAVGVTVVVGALIVIVVYGVLAWIFTAIACAIYNVAARWVGGIEVHVEPVAPPPPAPLWGPPTTSTPHPPTSPPAG